MSLLLSIYAWTIVASALLASGLALLGVHLAARDRAMQTMCLGQGAMLGVLLGIGLTQTWLAELEMAQGLPFGLAVAAAAGTYVLSERLVKTKAASRNTHFAALFSLLLAGGYLVSALFPALETHLAQRYFGDLATVSQGGTWVVLVVGTLLTLTLAVTSRTLGKESFQKAILGDDGIGKASDATFWFGFLSLMVLSFSVQIVGFLFTMACLFIPTAILSRTRRIGLTWHLVAAGGAAALGSAGGFVLSLADSKLPTVPAIAALTAVLATLVALSPARRHDGTFHGDRSR